MYKKTLTYTDYNGVERTEDFYFNLNKAELTEMEMTVDGGLSSKIERLVNSKDVAELVGIYKELILKSYGVKSPDGSRFVKNEKVLEDFVSSPAYSDIFMLLATDENEASEFITHVMPSDSGFREAIKKEVATLLEVE